MARRRQVFACQDADKALAAWVLEMDNAEHETMVFRPNRTTVEEVKTGEKAGEKVEAL